MNIRKATYRDAPTVKLLLEASGCKTTVSMLVGQLDSVFGGNDHEVLVYECYKEVIGVVTLHYLPQLAAERGWVWISCFLVDERYRNQDVAEALEAAVTRLALARKCDRMGLPVLDWLVSGDPFYARQGYRNQSGIYMKRLPISDVAF